MQSGDLRQAGNLLTSWRRVMLLSHDRPDGDALGALVGMRDVLNGLGIEATACVYDVIPVRYAFLESHRPLPLLPSGEPAAIDAQFDGILIMDTCSWSQLEPPAAYLRATRLPKLVIDHHATRDDLTASSVEAICVSDERASSVCVMLHEWCVAMGWSVSPVAGLAFFSGMATDTGWFRFSNTDARTLRSAGALVDAGLRPDLMYAQLMDSYSVARVRLLSEALATLQLHADGRVALMCITPEMMARAGAGAPDTEDIVNEPLKSRDVVASVLLIDMGDGRIRANFRSKSPEVVGYEIDVAAVAAGFGGGGHRRAAGARIAQPLEALIPQVVSAMGTALQAGRQPRTN